MSGNSGTGGPGPLTDEAYRWALRILGQAPPTADTDEHDDDERA